jgi:hypothetical protein
MGRIASRLDETLRRKERLIAQARAQRALLAGCVRELQGPIGFADQGFRLARYLRAHPLQVGAIVAVLMMLRRRGLASLAGRAFAAWRLWRSVSSLTSRW